MIKNKQNYSSNERAIMRTSILTLYPKIFTDIPFANKIFSSAVNLACEYGFVFQPDLLVAQLSVEIEARHKAVNQALVQNLNELGDNVIIVELASGLSPRKLEFSDYHYVEVDYPPVQEMKKEIYKNLGYRFNASDLIGANLTNREDLNRIENSILKINNKKSVIIVSEGLFWYLNDEGISNLAQKFYELTQKLNGLWITGDCPLAHESANTENYKAVIADSSKRSRDKPFDSYKSFKLFFNKIGFSVESKRICDLINLNELVSAKFFAEKESRVKERLDTYTNIATLTPYGSSVNSINPQTLS